MKLAGADRGALNAICPGQTIDDRLDGAVAQAATFTYVNVDSKFPFPLSYFSDFEKGVSTHYERLGVGFTGTSADRAILTCRSADDPTTFVSFSVVFAPAATPNNPDSEIECPTQVWYGDILTREDLPVHPDGERNQWG